MKLGELFIELDVKTNPAKIKRFDTSIKGVAVRLLGMQAAFAAGAFALNKFVSGTADGVVALQNISNQTGLAIDKLEQLGQAAQLSDLSFNAEQAARQVGALQKKIIEVRKFGGQAGFGLTTIGLQGDAFDVIERLREEIKGLDDATATGLIEKVGLSPQFINVLRLSNKEFQELGKNRFLSKAQRDSVIKLGTSFTRLKLNIIALKDQAVAKLSPILDKLIRGALEWFEQHGDAVISFFAGIGAAIGIFVRIVSTATGFVFGFFESLGKLADMFPIMKTALAGLAIAWGLMNVRMLVASAPLTAIAAAITGIVLVLDDFSNWVDGNGSVLGDLFGDYENSGIAQFFDWFGEQLETFKQSVDDFAQTVGNALSGAFADVADFFGFGGGDNTTLVAAGAPPISPATTNSILNNSQSTDNTSKQQNNYVTINATATGTQETADVIGHSVFDSINDRLKTGVFN